VLKISVVHYAAVIKIPTAQAIEQKANLSSSKPITVMDFQVVSSVRPDISALRWSIFPLHSCPFFLNFYFQNYRLKNFSVSQSENNVI
jgi:hypothetical protein